MTRLLVGLLGVCALHVWGALAFAQPKPGYSPSTTHIFPAGARRGTTVKVRVGAECIPPGTDFIVTGRGISKGGKLTKEVFHKGEASPKRVPTITPITHPREWAAELTIDKNARLGPVYWRVNCAQGGTGSRPFLIGDLPEHIETESNSKINRAERVELPVTLNGQIMGERDVDHYRFAVEAGQVVSCEVIAARIGSRLDPVVELLDGSGKKVDAVVTHVGSDPVLVFHSQSTAEYILRVSNVTFSGDHAHVYRINVRPNAFPRILLPGGVDRDTLASGDLNVISVAGKIPMIPEKMRLALEDEARNYAQWSVFDSFVGPQTLSIDPVEPVAEQEPNDSMESTQVVKTPTVLYGQFNSATDEDRFRITAKKGEPLRIEATAWPPGTPTLPVLSIQALDRKKKSRVIHAVTSGDRVARTTWTANEDQDIEVILKDLRHGSRGGLEFGWRLSITRDEPDFELEASADSLIVTQGQASTFEIRARRFGGLRNKIELGIQGLPEGVTAPEISIAEGQFETRFEFKATDEAFSSSYPLKIIGKVKVDGKTIERPVRFRHLGVDSEGTSVGLPTTETLHLSVKHKPLFRLFCPEAYLYAHRGSVFPYPMEVQRMNNFDGPIHVQQGDRQNRDMDGVQMLDTTVQSDQTNFFLPIYLPETMAINVQSQTQLYAQAWTTFKDSHGQEQAVLVLSEKRNMLRSMPQVVKLKSKDESVEIDRGGQATCRLYLQRTSNFDGSMKVELVSDPTMEGIAVDPVSFESGRSNLDIRIRAVPGLKTPRAITLRATGQLGDRKIISETQVRLQTRD